MTSIGTGVKVPGHHHNHHRHQEPTSTALEYVETDDVESIDRETRAAWADWGGGADGASTRTRQRSTAFDVELYNIGSSVEAAVVVVQAEKRVVPPPFRKRDKIPRTPVVSVHEGAREEEGDGEKIVVVKAPGGEKRENEQPKGEQEHGIERGRSRESSSSRPKASATPPTPRQPNSSSLSRSTSCHPSFSERPHRDPRSYGDHQEDQTTLVSLPILPPPTAMTTPAPNTTVLSTPVSHTPRIPVPPHDSPLHCQPLPPTNLDPDPNRHRPSSPPTQRRWRYCPNCTIL